MTTAEQFWEECTSRRAERIQRWAAVVAKSRKPFPVAVVFDHDAVAQDLHAMLRLAIYARLIGMMSGVFVHAERVEELLDIFIRSGLNHG